jgi:hypothetical protein
MAHSHPNGATYLCSCGIGFLALESLGPHQNRK